MCNQGITNTSYPQTMPAIAGIPANQRPFGHGHSHSASGQHQPFNNTYNPNQSANWPQSYSSYSPNQQPFGQQPGWNQPSMQQALVSVLNQLIGLLQSQLGGGQAEGLSTNPVGGLQDTVLSKQHELHDEFLKGKTYGSLVGQGLLNPAHYEQFKQAEMHEHMHSPQAIYHGAMPANSPSNMNDFYAQMHDAQAHEQAFQAGSAQGYDLTTGRQFEQPIQTTSANFQQRAHDAFVSGQALGEFVADGLVDYNAYQQNQQQKMAQSQALGQIQMQLAMLDLQLNPTPISQMPMLDPKGAAKAEANYNMAMQVNDAHQQGIQLGYNTHAKPHHHV